MLLGVAHCVDWGGFHTPKTTLFALRTGLNPGKSVGVYFSTVIVLSWVRSRAGVPS